MEPIYRLPPDIVMQVVTTPLSETRDWSLDFLGIPEVWQKTRGAVSGKPLIGCVLDTGVELRHKDLEGAILDARDFTRSRVGPRDLNGHGTWCFGMMFAREGNGIGVAGIANGAIG